VSPHLRPGRLQSLMLHLVTFAVLEDGSHRQRRTYRTGGRGKFEGRALALLESLVCTPQGTLFPVLRHLELDIKLLPTEHRLGAKGV